jgi:hypothetical protein
MSSKVVGPVFQKLLAHFSTTQLGKGWGDFGWRFEVQVTDEKLNGGNERRKGSQTTLKGLTIMVGLVQP